eukprot:12279728-Karenia_brevis.AAC.1
MVLRLERRKNKINGSTLSRGCWCSESKVTCPLHVLSPWIAQRRDAGRLFPSFTAAKALLTLRQVLESMGVERAREYRTHDLRRGHTEDLRQK